MSAIIQGRKVGIAFLDTSRSRLVLSEIDEDIVEDIEAGFPKMQGIKMELQVFSSLSFLFFGQQHKRYTKQK